MEVNTSSPLSLESWTSGMHLLHFANEFPHDDLQNTLRKVYSNSKDSSYPLLAQFLHCATRAVYDEVERLPRSLRDIIPPFESFLDWAGNAELRNGQLCGSIDGVLLVLLQLATFIAYAETRPGEFPTPTNTILTGLGVGMFSSTAISVSPSLAELPLAGADAVRLAFRMGVHVMQVSSDLEAQDPSDGANTWAYVVHTVEASTVQRELDSFNERENLPNTGKLFVSAENQTSCTVSGPPSRLKSLFRKSAYFRDSRSIALPVFGGLCHAGHVYDLSDAQSIARANTLNCTTSERFFPTIPVLSTSTGKPLPASAALELFENVIAELLIRPITLRNVISGIVGHAAMSRVLQCRVFCVRNSAFIRELIAAMSERMSELRTSTCELMLWFAVKVSRRASLGGSSGPAQSKLAIVGMSCRLPGGANNTEKFWEVLEQQLDVSRKIPADRFDVDTHYDSTGQQLNKTMTQYGCFIDEPGLFDAPFFNMSPREAETIDPQMRLALVTAYEALESAGCIKNRTPSSRSERVGTYYGQAADDYREVNQGQSIGTYYIPGGCRAFGPGRINYFFKFSGPSYSIDTACSSGLAAIEIACKALWSGDVDTAITGGLNVLTNPDGFTGLCNGHFLSKGHNACKTWDATADGYCRADGIVSIVIKRIEDAISDNDNILGVILGAGTNHSAEAVSITHPHAGHQAYLANQVLRRSNVNPLDVSYVELHGTGTQAGDCEEMKGVMDVYAPLGRSTSLVKCRDKDRPLYIGASKANIGHGESAAGASALVKVLLMLQKNAIPAHIGIKTEMNPNFPTFEGRNLHIPLKLTSWEPVPGRKRIAAVNNFGAAGGNTTLLLEEAPERCVIGSDRRPVYAVTLSAKNKQSLLGNLELMEAYLGTHQNLALSDLSYTTTARRHHYKYRLTMTVSTPDQLEQQLSSKKNLDNLKPVSKPGSAPITFLFTGQGATYKSANLELYHDVPSFRATIQHLDSLAQHQGFESFIPAIDGSHHQDHSHSTVVTQLALVCTEIALARYWETLGIKPDVVMGHSLGEYAAMCIAGVLSASDTIYLVGRRAQLLDQKCRAGSHQMMAVRASLAQISGVTDIVYTVSCVNGPQDTVLSGTVEQMELAAERLGVAGFRCITLDVAFAFHSQQTDSILDEFESIAKTSVLFKEPSVPFISPLHGTVIFDDKTLNAKYVRDATRDTVNFLGALRAAEETSTISSDTIWVEVGPHPVCCGFVRSAMTPVKLALPSLRRGENNWTTMTQALAALHTSGNEVDWNTFHQPFEQAHRLLDLPTYAWNEKNYWLKYNGDWALTKGNDFYDSHGSNEDARLTNTASSNLNTSTVHRITEERFGETSGTVTVESDLMQPDFLAAANGHRMNDCGVVTSSIHADIAYTLGEYLYRRLTSAVKPVSMNLADLAVTKGLVANRNTDTPQIIRVTIATEDLASRTATLVWQTIENKSFASNTFATAKIIYGETTEWSKSWIPMAHLIQGRIHALDQLAIAGKANRFTRSMAYNLFAKNLVDYSEKYRGMQSVTMHELEAFADVQLAKETGLGGTWTIPPYFIDSVAHLAGFVMNCSDSNDTTRNYYVTPGWQSMRFAKSLQPAAHYRSYVKMIPTAEDPGVYLGDVYILQDDVIIGMVGAIQFRQFPRILLGRFFSPPDRPDTTAPSGKNDISGLRNSKLPGKEAITATLELPTYTKATVHSPESTPSARTLDGNHVDTSVDIIGKISATQISIVGKPRGMEDHSDSVASVAIRLIAEEAGLGLEDLDDDAGFEALGIDSLMSLVISERLRKELNVKVGGSIFLDYPTIGDLRMWLKEAYS